MAKEDFKNLLNKVSVQKEKEVPFQKVVPTEKIKNNNRSTNSTLDLIKISLSIYIEDWMDIIRFKNYKILEQKNLDYTISDVIQYGLGLLEEEHQIKRNRDKLNLKRGRRNKEKVIAVKTSSIDLPNEKVEFINDFLYYKVFDKKNLEYTRPEMFSEMVSLIKNNNKNIFEN